MIASPQSLRSVNEVVNSAKAEWVKRIRLEAYAANMDPHVYLRRSAESEHRRQERFARIRALEIFDPPIKPEMKQAILQMKEAETDAVSLVRHWMKETKFPYLVICGAPGIGKTAASAFGACIYGGGVHELATNLATRMTVDYDNPVEDKVMRSGYVTIDELGEETKNDYWEGKFRAFISLRPSRGRTLFLTNLLPADLERRYTSRIWDKVTEYGKVEVLQSPCLRKAASIG